MSTLVYYLPRASGTSPFMVASAVWRHLHGARDGLEPDLRLITHDPEARERYSDIVLPWDEARTCRADTTFYLPVGPVVGKGEAFRTLLRLRRIGARLACDYHGDLRDDLQSHLRNRDLGLALFTVPSAVLAPIMLDWHDWIVLHSRRLEDTVRRRYRLRARTAVVPNGIEGSLLDEDAPWKEPGDELRVCFHGRLTHEKGLDLLLRACASLPPSARGRVRLHLVGEGPLRPALSRLASRLGIADRVHLEGARPREEVYPILRSSHLAIYPSRSDSFPVSVLEALATTGGPVLFSDSSGIAEVAGADLAGNIIPPTEAAVRDALLKAIEGRLDVGAMVGAQRALARELTWDRVIQRYVVLFNDMAAGA